MRKLIGVLALLVLTAVLTASATAVNVAQPPPAAGFNRATLTCDFWQQYQRHQVDPIVQPGAPVSAHSHDFYGRQDISSFMFAKAWWPPRPENDPGYGPISSSCKTYGDWAGYWFPTPIWNGASIQNPAWNVPGGNLIETWQSPVGSTVATPPWGATYVVGNARANSEAQEGPHVRFTCGNLDGAGSQAPQDCTTTGGLVTAELTFPDCFDGQTQLYADYSTPAGIDRKHFAYSVGGVCPGGFGMRIAQLITQQHFIDPRTGVPMVNPRNADGSLGLSFASGPYYTYHGDFLNSWNVTLEMIVQGCLNHTRACIPLQ